MNWTGTVHYADDAGRPCCGLIKSHNAWLRPTVATVTCKRCIVKLGADAAGHVDPPAHNSEHVERRAAERAARRAARTASA